jgi:hypothetical protein
MSGAGCETERQRYRGAASGKPDAEDQATRLA